MSIFFNNLLLKSEETKRPLSDNRPFGLIAHSFNNFSPSFLTSTPFILFITLKAEENLGAEEVDRQDFRRVF